MRLLVVNADDLGLSPGVNDGIFAAYAHGIVTSASLMVDRAGAEDAAVGIKGHPGLSVGLHFEEDRLPQLDDDHVAELFAAQLRRFRALTGGDPTHVDSHHHVHRARPKLFAALAAPLGVPVRHDGRVTYLGDFYGRSEDGAPTPDRISGPFLLELLAHAERGPASELGCHPGRVRADFRSSYREERAIELATLTAPGLGEEIAALGFTLAGFRQV